MLRSKTWLLLLTCLCVLPPVSVLAEGEDPSHSSKESAKRELLIKKVYPMPDVFDWNNHEVSFQESWMERNPNDRHNLLCFRLLVDNSPTKELALQKNANRSMEFREEGSRGDVFVISRSVFYPLRNIKRIGRGSGEIVHYAEIKDSRVRKVALRIYTNDHNTDTHEKTSVVLNFDDLRVK